MERWLPHAEKCAAYSLWFKVIHQIGDDLISDRGDRLQSRQRALHADGRHFIHGFPHADHERFQPAENVCRSITE